MNKVTKNGWIAGLALVLGLGFTTNSVAQDSTKVFFSEYIEGSSNNKALEIYNGTGVEIDLSKVQVIKGNNGIAFESADSLAILQLEGTLAAGDVYVIANAESNAAILAVADTTFIYSTTLRSHQVVTFNGDDAVGLFYNGALVDQIGQSGTDPGTSWAVAGTGATANFTLVRKIGKTGNKEALGSLGTDEATSEWIVYPIDTFTYLGTHDFYPKYNITFQADLNPAIDSANFVPGTHNVILKGSMNDWGSDTLKDANEDGIYEVTLALTADTYNFKYFVTSRQYPSGEWEPDPNNSVVVVDKDSVLAAVAPRINFANYSDVTFDKVAVYFQLNMQVQLLTGNFSVERGDKVEARGSFNGWGAGDELTETEDPNLYEGFVYLDDFALGQTINYKFVTVNGGDDAVNWEGGDNKTITVENREYTTEERFDGYILVVASDPENIPYFNNVTPDKIFTEAADVLFQVDLRPAYYYLADSGKVAADVQNNHVATAINGLFANGPLVNHTTSWEDWGDNLSLRDDLKLFDDGTNGDKVAGDSVFSRTFSFDAGDVREGNALKFGINGYDNEAGSGSDRFPRLTNGEEINFIFGAVMKAAGPYTELYAPYIGYNEETSSFFVRRRPVNTSNESVNAPNQFELNQNFPNPFNPTTTIRFNLANSENVRLTVYNMLGQKVATLINNAALAAGQHSIAFDASKLASGAYLYRIEAGSFSATKKMTLIK